MPRTTVTSSRFGSRMRALRHERGLSLRALQVRALSSRSRLSEYETGKSLPPRDVAHRIDDALRAGGELTAILSAALRTVSSAEGLEFSMSWQRAVEVAAGLWRGDMERRQVLRGAAFAATAFVTPAMRAMTPVEEYPIGGGSVDVEQPHVELIRRVTATFRTLDNEYGGGQVRETAVRFLHSEVAPLLQGRFNEPVGRSLFSATAELTQLAGWAAYDAGLHGLAQRYLIQALRLAIAAADRPLGAEVLAAMSHQAAYLLAPVEAIDLARAAGRLAADAGVEAILAETAVLEAHGHALAGDERACADALNRAEKTLDRADRQRDPQWIGYFDEAYLSAKFGHCFAALARGDLAQRFAARSLQMDGRYVRGRQFNLALLARAYAQTGEVEQASATGLQAVELAETLQSQRSVDYLRDLADRLAAHVGLPAVDEFTERARPLLT
jgi:transcriptional regulator with XRE-family HTH domain